VLFLCVILTIALTVCYKTALFYKLIISNKLIIEVYVVVVLNDKVWWSVGYVTFGRYLNMTQRPMIYACDWPQVLRHFGSQVFGVDVFHLK